MSNAEAILFDARELEHPEPLNRAVAILRTLTHDRYLHMIHKKEPIPLLELAQKRGFYTLSKQDDKGVWHIFIARDSLKSLLEKIDV